MYRLYQCREISPTSISVFRVNCSTGLIDVLSAVIGYSEQYDIQGQPPNQVMRCPWTKVTNSSCDALADVNLCGSRSNGYLTPCQHSCYCTYSLSDTARGLCNGKNECFIQQSELLGPGGHLCQTSKDGNFIVVNYTCNYQRKYQSPGSLKNKLSCCLTSVNVLIFFRLF